MVYQFTNIELRGVVRTLYLNVTDIILTG